MILSQDSLSWALFSRARSTASIRLSGLDRSGAGPCSKGWASPGRVAPLPKTPGLDHKVSKTSKARAPAGNRRATRTAKLRAAQRAAPPSPPLRKAGASAFIQAVLGVADQGAQNIRDDAPL